MKEKEEQDILNKENDDAQPVSASELLPIYDAMDYSGDIQPLDDIENPEPVVTDYNHLFDDSHNQEKGKESKKRKTPKALRFNRKWKKAVLALFIIAVLCSATAVFSFWITYRNVNKFPVQTAYSSESKLKIVLTDKSEYTIDETENVVVSKDGMRVYYSTNTSSKTGKYDIHFIDVSNKSSLEKGGSYIDNGIDDTWEVSSDGTYVCYSKSESETEKYYMYSSIEKKSHLITNNLDELYMPKTGDIVYFTRTSGSTYSLHRDRYGEDSQNVASGIDFARECDSDGLTEIVYTVKTGTDENVDVYVVSGDNEPKKVCSNVSEVYVNDYVAGGNLYYFTKNESKVDWQDFISDEYFDSDLSMEKPVEGNYLIEKGFIFKRYVLDEVAYNNAVKEYNKKLVRDNIREALSKIDLGLTMKEQYTCYCWNSKGSQKLSTGVVLENVLSYAPTGEPRIIFRKNVIDVENKITMDKLVSVAQSGTADEAVDYVRDNIRKSYTVSDDCLYSWYDGGKVLEYTINEYDSSNTEFIFCSRNILCALSDGALYKNNISESEISSRELIDENVTDFTTEDGALYYYKTETGVQPSLYKYSVKSDKQLISDNVYSYFVINDDYTIVLSSQNNESENMTIGYFSAGEYKVSDADASINYFIHNESGFAYIRISSGEVYASTQSNGIFKVGDSGDKIYYTHN